MKLLKSSYDELPESLYTITAVNIPRESEIVVFNETLAQSLGLPLDTAEALLKGEVRAEMGESMALAYAGHQFGHFTMLGDGRAHLLGEVEGDNGVRYDIQLKGSGRTPYSRGGDGKAVLGPMLREYLISEAMHYLGVDTTRSLGVINTHERIVRQTIQEGAVLCRIARGHLRVGSFQLAAARNDITALKQLIEYGIKRYAPACAQAPYPPLAFLEFVCGRQGALIAKWQLIGFVHGVMNTDNVSIAGETIDYGPCAFLDGYSGGQSFSSIDTEGRYAYGNQPYMGGWNVTRLAESLVPLLRSEYPEGEARLSEILERYYESHLETWRLGFGQKLGLDKVSADMDAFFQSLLSLMETYQLDFTNTFLDLMKLYENREGHVTEGFEVGGHYLCALDAPFEAWQPWLTMWSEHLKTQTLDELAVVLKRMQLANPQVIPRNHLVDEAIASAENGDYEPFFSLLSHLKNPYGDSALPIRYQMPNPSRKPHKTFCGT